MFDSTSATNLAAATRFIDVFNTDSWDTLSEVVTHDFTLHHPMGGTKQLGPEGMAQVWGHFKAALPDSWHPIPVMITEGDYLANLLPTYGTFDGEPHHGIPPTGRRLEYGMVNIVRFEDAKLAEAWFGMDPLVELQQMGAAPTPPDRKLTPFERENIDRFRETVPPGARFDKVTAIGETVIALGPPQFLPETRTRELDIFEVFDGKLRRIYHHDMTIDPPYTGNPTADTEVTKLVAKRYFEEVLAGHELEALAMLASPDILIHPTGMPCEATHYGLKGAARWLTETWSAFPDLVVEDVHSVASGDILAVRWSARGTSKGAFLHLPPTDAVVEFTGVSMYRVEDGLIAEIWETCDTFGIMRQLNPELGQH